MKPDMITVKVLREFKQKTRKYIGRLKTHRDFVDFMNHAADHYLVFLKEQEEKKSE